MGGHGGLNILPQKRWNVYRADNREKVRRDEEAAAREEHLKREQARKRDAEFRLERLRASKGLAPLIQPQESEAGPHEPEPESEPVSSPKDGHINLFEGIKIFDPIRVPEKDAAGEKERERSAKNKKRKKEEEVVVTPEDEKYRFGYSYLGKQVKLPWYLEKRGSGNGDEVGDDERRGKREKSERIKSGKKTLEELREERLKRERVEKERERALIHGKQNSDRPVFGSSKFHYRR